MARAPGRDHRRRFRRPGGREGACAARPSTSRWSTGRNHHLFQPLLYQVATGILSQGNIAPPLRDVLRRQRNAQVVLADVGGVDLERRTVACGCSTGHGSSPTTA